MSRHGERPEETWVFSFFIFGSFREIYTRYYERHKADVSCFFFYLEVLAALYFERGLLNMNVPWRFEYVNTSYELDYLHPERSEAVDVKHFISVLEMFKHHYTGELMYKVREDYIEPCGVPVSREYILTEPAILDMLKDRID